MKSFPFIPPNDGIDHVNLYSKGKTVAGRVLTHMSNASVTIDGLTFNQLEGYWYYRRILEVLARKPQGVPLRVDSAWVQVLQGAPSGFEAKRHGRKYLSLFGEGEPKTEMTEEFRNHIREANKQRLEQNKFLLGMLLSTKDIPLAHYYFYGHPTNPRIMHDPIYDWIPKYLEELRAGYWETIPKESIHSLVKWANDKVPTRPMWNGCIVFDVV